MGNIFQVECIQKHDSECHFGLLWLRKLAKALARTLGKENRHRLEFYL